MIEKYRTTMTKDVIHSWAADAQKELERQANELKAATEAMNSALRLVVDVRWALGDEGSRMQPELIACAAELLKDAERYRLLRRGQHWSVIDYIGDPLRGEVLDAAVDARLAMHANTEGQRT